jgi:hypothetical protein
MKPTRQRSRRYPLRPITPPKQPITGKWIVYSATFKNHTAETVPLNPSINPGQLLISPVNIVEADQ